MPTSTNTKAQFWNLRPTELEKPTLPRSGFWELTEADHHQACLPGGTLYKSLRWPSGSPQSLGKYIPRPAGSREMSFPKGWHSRMPAPPGVDTSSACLLSFHPLPGGPTLFQAYESTSKPSIKTWNIMGAYSVPLLKGTLVKAIIYTHIHTHPH